MRTVIAGVLLALVSTSALAQSAPAGVYDQGGRNVYQFRTPDERISRLAVLQEEERRRQGLAAGGSSGSGGSGSGLASATAINNYFQVTNTNTLNCSGTGVTCTGGNANVHDVTQTTTGSTADADNVLTGNTVTNSRTVNRTTQP